MLNPPGLGKEPLDFDDDDDVFDVYSEPDTPGSRVNVAFLHILKLYIKAEPAVKHQNMKSYHISGVFALKDEH